jgi:hypothetical protein
MKTMENAIALSFYFCCENFSIVRSVINLPLMEKLFSLFNQITSCIFTASRQSMLANILKKNPTSYRKA